MSATSPLRPCYESLDTHTWLRAAAGAGGGWSLKQDTVGFLFCLLLFHWRFPIYLSDQVIEDLRRHNKDRWFNRGAGLLAHDPSLKWQGFKLRVRQLSLQISQTNLRKEGSHLGALTSRTLIFDLAEDSKKAQWFHCLARFWPCSFPTTRSSSKSHLFPTRIIGTWWRNNTVASFMKLTWQRLNPRQRSASCWGTQWEEMRTQLSHLKRAYAQADV